MRPTWPSRRPMAAIVLVAAVAVTAAACSSSKSSSGSGTTIASKLTLGGPAECQTNAFCIPALQKTYGITFKGFKTLDADGPLTYAALSAGQVEVGEVFSTDAQVVAHNLVVLNDDKHSQPADAITPVIATAKATPGVTTVVNNVSAALTTDILLNLNKSVGVDHQDPQAVADQWLQSKSLATSSTSASGVSITIAAFNFSESDLLAYIYGDALKAAGASITVKPNLGSRQTLEPGLQSGQFDMLVEYAASALEFLDHSAGLANGDINNNVGQLKTLLSAKNITVLTPSSAVDTNAFAVTKATAAKYNLVNMSDLAKNG
jgi:osmoprotectant transport system substrate-binding protein